MHKFIGLIVLVFCSNLYCLAQQCPERQTTGPDRISISRTLTGKLVYHDGIRQWFELMLDQNQCGQNSIQLMQDDAPNAWLTIRGCRVRSVGALGDSGTGYYSLDLYQLVEKIVPIGRCPHRRVPPDLTALKPASGVQHYRVLMLVNYRAGDHPIRFIVTSGGRRLSPWQSYATYTLTGGFVLYGMCAEKFSVNRVFGTHEANPDLSEFAAFDPEAAASAGKRNLRLGFTCIRDEQNMTESK